MVVSAISGTSDLTKAQDSGRKPLNAFARSRDSGSFILPVPCASDSSRCLHAVTSPRSFAGPSDGDGPVAFIDHGGVERGLGPNDVLCDVVHDVR
jgi:hypothetical protein